MAERSHCAQGSLKLAWRVAGRVRDQLERLAFNRLLDVRHEYCDLSTHLERWRKTSRHIDLAARRRWPGVLPAIRRNLDYLFTDLQRELSNARRLTERWEPLPIPTMRDVIDDLDQLEAEFDEWSYGSNGILSVTTEPITLEGVYLGPFAIRLELNQLQSLGRNRAYRIEALEPYPAVGSDHVTHPHVSSDDLCEGEASIPIRSSLEQGRLADFFMLVNSVLTTYNAGSPYVELDLWDGGITCHECGDHVSDDDRSCCQRCDHDFCPDCTSRCEGCEEYFCTGCLKTCPGCDNPACEGCLRSCDQCDRGHEAVCVDCLDDGTCPTCREEQDEPDETDDDDGGEEGEDGSAEDGDEGRGPLGLPPADDDDATCPDPAILALCLGEAAGIP